MTCAGKAIVAHQSGPSLQMYRVIFFLTCSVALLAIVLFIMIGAKFKFSIVIPAGVSTAYLAYLLAHWATLP